MRAVALLALLLALPAPASAQLRASLSGGAVLPGPHPAALATLELCCEAGWATVASVRYSRVRDAREWYGFVGGAQGVVPFDAWLASLAARRRFALDERHAWWAQMGAGYYREGTGRLSLPRERRGLNAATHWDGLALHADIGAEVRYRGVQVVMHVGLTAVTLDSRDAVQVPVGVGLRVGQ